MQYHINAYGYSECKLRLKLLQRMQCEGMRLSGRKDLSGVGEFGEAVGLEYVSSVALWQSFVARFVCLMKSSHPFFFFNTLILFGSILFCDAIFTLWFKFVVIYFYLLKLLLFVVFILVVVLYNLFLGVYIFIINLSTIYYQPVSHLSLTCQPIISHYHH